MTKYNYEFKKKVVTYYIGILKQEMYYEKVCYSYEELEQAIINYIDYGTVLHLIKDNESLFRYNFPTACQH